MLSRATRPVLKAGLAASTRLVQMPSWPPPPPPPPRRYARSRNASWRPLRCNGLIAPNRSSVPQGATYATLREIEGRLKSIRNIEKITKTMKVVASTKLTRAQRAMTESRAYGQASNTVFEQAETKPLEGEGRKDLIVVASSDKGLCGGIHSGLTKSVRRMLLEHPDADLVVIGEKSKSQLGRSNAKNMVLSFSNLGKNVPTFADAQAVADKVSSLPGDYAAIHIVYNRFINPTSYEPKVIEAFSEDAIRSSRALIFAGSALAERSLVADEKL